MKLNTVNENLEKKFQKFLLNKTHSLGKQMKLKFIQNYM